MADSIHIPWKCRMCGVTTSYYSSLGRLQCRYHPHVTGKFTPQTRIGNRNRVYASARGCKMCNYAYSGEEATVPTSGDPYHGGCVAIDHAPEGTRMFQAETYYAVIPLYRVREFSYASATCFKSPEGSYNLLQCKVIENRESMKDASGEYISIKVKFRGPTLSECGLPEDGRDVEQLRLDDLYDECAQQNGHALLRNTWLDGAVVREFANDDTDGAGVVGQSRRDQNRIRSMVGDGADEAADRDSFVPFVFILRADPESASYESRCISDVLRV